VLIHVFVFENVFVMTIWCSVHVSRGN